MPNYSIPEAADCIRKMEAKSYQQFSVTRQEPELITPARPTPREVKQLSDIDDQEGLRAQMSNITFYRNNPSPSMEGKDPTKVIREALSKTLVFYYPLAGRLQEGPNRKLMVDCNGEGVLFLEAEANFTLEQLGGDEIKPPFPYLNAVLYDVPGSRGIIGCPLLLIQVTRLTCGGFILALRFNHTIMDALGLMQFVKILLEFARGVDSPSLMPVWQREILSARNPPQMTHIHHEYEKVIQSKNVEPNTEPTEDKSFFFGPKEISAIRNNLPLHLKNCSTFELLAACIWKCRTTALKFDGDQIVRFSCAVNIRNKHYNIQLPPGYYGNAFAFPAVCAKVDDLCKNPLEYAVELVQKAKAKMSEEYIKSLVDFMVIMGRPLFTIEGNFIFSNVTRLESEKTLDFGWGSHVYAGPARSVSSLVGNYMKYKNGDGEDGVLVLLCLRQSAMERFEKELKKITHGSLEDSYNMKNTEILSKY